MPITVGCMNCRQVLAAPDSLAGKQVVCPRCKNPVPVPAATTPPQQGIRPAPAPAVPQQQFSAAPPPPAPYHAPYAPPIRPESFRNLSWWLRLLIWAVLGVFGIALFGVLLMVLGTVVAGATNNSQAPAQDQSPVGGFMILAGYMILMLSYLLLFIPMIAHAVVWFIFLYKSWQLIQDGQVRTTPGQAIGFMFIPFFNFYWIFVSIKGLTEDLNTYAQQRSIPAQANVGLSTTYCVLTLCTAIPCLGLLIVPINLFVQLKLVDSIQAAAAEIAAVKLGLPPGTY